jgi:pyruvate/2-oxoglutarate dehydrogenase complex dihydrolipoamide dehydrogenase (E3) component
MSRIETDICIIGAGSGGLSVAAGAVQMGAKVVLIEGHKMGGDCLNYGCVPSKALLAAGHKAHDTATAAFGTAGHPPGPDLPPPRTMCQRHRHDRPRRQPGTVRGPRRPRDPRVRRFHLGDRGAGRAHVIKARRFVIATGSRPFVPPIPGLKDTPHHTNETIFDLRERPDHLIIIGGGPIGMEMAQAHRRLGSR